MEAIIGTLNVEITRAVVLTGRGTDKIQLKMVGPSPFPAEVQNYGVITIETTKGWGENYCRDVLGLEPEIIEI